MSSLLNATVATGPTAGTLAPHSQLFLSTTDYVVFTSMLGISAAIGVYFGFFAKGADTTEEYLMGGKRLRMVPIAISLVASQLSAISIMSIPAEMYAYGINWMFTVVSMVLVVPLLNYVVIPVFYNNHITNCYEYLELRFCREMRVMQTFIFIISTFFMLPIIIFLPSLAFAQVTGYNVHVINVVVSSICIFYTMFGGIKAVVWTDVIQAAIMVMSVVLVGVLGAYRVGGLSEVLRIAGEGGRLDINYNFDLSTRSTIWNVFTSATLTWSGTAIPSKPARCPSWTRSFPTSCRTQWATCGACQVSSFHACSVLPSAPSPPASIPWEESSTSTISNHILNTRSTGPT
ncbi:sodium-coupled monocarboxylate transporter 1 isoform X3 [Drosophila biarmipes]|uniref:sodium-coupled monocarboxylate transporter 1 isoform X3 n=1 Tax=Drosophila biarmipes TaxID=125945 RepID=UPI0007E8168A|nr:sodium-coupled monocarboxylate transporter 1 isoform X3 [Drosophila biarmipes]